MKLLIGLLLVAGLIYAGVMYSRQDSNLLASPSMQPTAFQPLASASPQAMTEESASPTTEAMMEEDADGVKVFKVSGANFRFSPDTITVQKGDKVRVMFTSMDMQHDFDLDEFDVDGPVTVAGETSEVEFTVDQVGEFEYYCSVGQHRANGMVGTLIVE